MHYTNFQQAVMNMGLTEDGLWLEGVDAGTSNIVLNLNYRGVTWAVAVRIPVTGTGEEYARQKERTINVTQYLAKIFADGVDLEDGNRLVFDGLSYLTDAQSTIKFLVKQAQRPTIEVVDQIRGSTPDLRPPRLVDQQLMEYEGPFFVSKGAPANETLEHDSRFGDAMLRSLAALHVHTGAKKSLREDKGILEEIDQQLMQSAKKWIPGTGSKAETRIHKYANMIGKAYDWAKCEVFLQQEVGRRLVEQLTHQYFSDEAADRDYQSFIHGDAHGRNFIIVQFAYLQSAVSFLDRKYLNDLFDEFPEIHKITVEVDHNVERIIYRQYQIGDEHNKASTVATRGSRIDVHLIDPDTGRGINSKEKACCLLDVVTLCLSIKHWHTIHGRQNASFTNLINIYSKEFLRQRER